MDENLNKPDVLSQLAFIAVASLVGFLMSATALQIATLPGFVVSANKGCISGADLTCAAA